ncbi:MAG: class I SAM-dependent methyltransferase [Planctomycetota bacterium]
MKTGDRVQKQTIEDFSQQWAAYSDNEGYYGSKEMFADMFHPLLRPEELKGARVADIGSGAGRTVRMLIGAGVSRVLAIEPSRAIEVLRENTREYADRISYLNVAGDQIPPSGALDYVISVGVLHHIPEPVPTVAAAFRALKPGGRMAIWIYGAEGNRCYLAVAKPLRALTTRLPHGLLVPLVWAFDCALVAYVQLCRFLPLPLRGYMREVVARLDGAKRRLTIYDQLNPAYAKYYTREEAGNLLTSAGFEDVRLHHRHGYSWAVIGTKPKG